MCGEEHVITGCMRPRTSNEHCSAPSSSTSTLIMSSFTDKASDFNGHIDP